MGRPRKCPCAELCARYDSCAVSSASREEVASLENLQDRFNVSSLVRSARFPAAGFRSHEAFQTYLRDHQSGLDAHYAYELSLATKEAHLICKGTCAPCLRPSTFVSSTQDGEAMPDGRRMPNWREQMRCDCEDRLIARQRALIHFLQATVLTPWTHLLLFGPPSEADRRLESLADATTRVPRLRRSATSVNGPSGPLLRCAQRQIPRRGRAGLPAIRASP